MTYRCGIGVSAARLIGVEPDDPRVTCDGCGLVLRISVDRPPPAWLLDGRAPPGWRLVRGDENRRDYCPRCKDAQP